MTHVPAAVLQADTVSKAFARRVGIFKREAATVVREVTLDLRDGEILGLVGESGSGKTTLSRMLLGALAPTTGSITLRGRPLGDFTRAERAREVQMVYQDPYSSLNPARTVGSVLDQVLRVHGVADPGQRSERIREVLDLVGLGMRYLHTLPGELSGGQRQRVVIARALVLRPKILICDEPTSALDVSIQAQILNLLMDIRNELGLAYLFVSHNLAVVEHLADRVAVMYGGRIVELADAEEVFRRPRHPYSRLLASSVVTPERIDATAAKPASNGHAGSRNEAGCVFFERCRQAGDKCRVQSPALMPLRGAFVACFHPNGPSAVPEQP